MLNLSVEPPWMIVWSSFRHTKSVGCGCFVYQALSCLHVVFICSAALHVWLQNMPPAGVIRPMGQQPGMMGAGERSSWQTRIYPCCVVGSHLQSCCNLHAVLAVCQHADGPVWRVCVPDAGLFLSVVDDESAMMTPMPGYATGMAPVAYAYPPEYAAVPGEPMTSAGACSVHHCCNPGHCLYHVKLTLLCVSDDRLRMSMACCRHGASSRGHVW